MVTNEYSVLSVYSIILHIRKWWIHLEMLPGHCFVGGGGGGLGTRGSLKIFRDGIPKKLPNNSG